MNYSAADLVNNLKLNAETYGVPRRPPEELAALLDRHDNRHSDTPVEHSVTEVYAVDDLDNGEALWIESDESAAAGRAPSSGAIHRCGGSMEQAIEKPYNSTPSR